jgi:hypothetical protein
MSDKTINTWLDIAPEYLDFSIKFIRFQPDAFEKLIKPGKVSSDLTSILMGGMALSYLLVLVAGSPELQSDPSEIAEWARRLTAIDVLLLPVVGLLGVFAVAVAGHIFTKATLNIFSLGGRIPVPFAKLPGSAEDTVNAALGFASVFVPFCAAVLCALSWLPSQLVPLGMWLVIALVIFLFIYYGWSLIATHHDINIVQAFYNVVLGVLPTWALWYWLTYS